MQRVGYLLKQRQFSAPLPFDPLAYRGGAARGEGRRLRGMIAEVRALPGRRVVQLNHPRSKRGEVSDLNYFTHLGVVGEPFRRTEPLSAWPNQVLVERDPATGLRDLDFDVIELLNGHSMRQFRAVRSDWYALLLQGEFRPAVANSDSHDASELVGYPRTYVRMPEGAATDPASLDADLFIAALAAGRAYGSTGPLLDVWLETDSDRTGLGGLHGHADGVLRVSVRTAPWIPISELRVLQSGREVHRAAISPDATAAIAVTFERDGFLTVEVTGGRGPDYERIAPGFTPLAFTNPIFVDADGDGRYVAPGLPSGSLPILEPGDE